MEIKRDLVEEAAYDAGLEEEDVRLDYSGRAMYGDRCFGIVTSDPGKVIEFSLRLAQRQAEQDESGYGLESLENAIADMIDLLGNARLDSMGLSTITYWPRLKVVD